MKRKYILIAVLLVIAICLFTVPRSYIISGDGDVLSLDKEKIGVCELSVEIRQLRSLLFCYDRSFVFSLDGKEYTEFASSSHAEANGTIIITQMFYNDDTDCMDVCTLIYPWNHLYAVLRMDDKVYFISETNMSHEQLPIDWN